MPYAGTGAGFAFGGMDWVFRGTFLSILERSGGGVMTSSYPGEYVPGASAPAYPAGPGPGQPQTSDQGIAAPDQQTGGQRAGEVAGTAKDQAGQVAGTAKDQAGQVAGTAKDQAGQVAGTAKEQASAVAATATESTRRVAGEATAQARDLAGEARSQLTEQVQLQQQKLAGTLRELADELAAMAQHSTAEHPDQEGIATDLVRQASEKTRTVARYVDERTPGDLLDELRGLGRRRPVAFLAGAAALGMLAGRLTKASGQAAKSERDEAQLEPAYEPIPAAPPLPPSEDPGYLGEDAGLIAPGVTRPDVSAPHTAGAAFEPLPEAEPYPQTGLPADTVGRSGV